MRILFHYIFRQTMLYVFVALVIASAIYTLADLFDRLDNFIVSGIGIHHVLWYYLMRLPTIVAQVLPSCFLLATLAQLSIMARSWELIALQAGGVSFARIAGILLWCGLACGLVQFFFSQSFALYGERNARRFWAEEVQKKNTDSNFFVRDLWFEDGAYKVHIATLYPHQGKGLGLTAYRAGENAEIAEIIWAQEVVQAKPGEWVIHDVLQYFTMEYRSTPMQELTLPLQVSARDFEWHDASIGKVTLPLWELGKVIEIQQATGSNVENLRTAWHMKVSAAASFMVLALVSVAVITWRDNIYLCMAIGLVIVFFLFLMTSFSPTLGSYGVMPPFWAAWFPNTLFFLLAMARLIWFHWPHRPEERREPAAA